MNVDSWYWGHGRVGDYSIVWFDFIGMDKKNYISSYVAKAGEILAASCTAGAIKVRPTGANNAYPPHTLTGVAGGFHIVADLGDLGTLDVNVTTANLIFNGLGLYNRMAGSVVASLNGGELITGGIALWEQFAMTLF